MLGPFVHKISNYSLQLFPFPYAICDMSHHIWHISFWRRPLSGTQFDRVAVRVADEELRIARAATAVADRDAHQVKLLPIAQIVPASREAQIGTRQGFQSERVFVKARRAFDVGHEKSGVMKTGDGDRHNCSPFV